ncbi:hypothetical protein CEXT_517361 [Caerostris extrusa]|uniref:Uncharacterized protein n=1 Tax=Caerostris extrusa TaxID=172846 RepID=A0AAV4VBF6_CAEEX|nr:hypothetical protein CEXT_517361 [Caerostris extrusa]
MKLLQPKKTLGQMTSPTGSLSRPIFQTVNLSRFSFAAPFAPYPPLPEETCWILLPVRRWRNSKRVEEERNSINIASIPMQLEVSIPFSIALKKSAGFSLLEVEERKRFPGSIQLQRKNFKRKFGIRCERH